MIADAFPLDPPTTWFTDLPDWFVPNMKLTVITDGPEAGRVAGSVAQRGTFLLNGGVPWQSSDSPSQYRDAMQGDTVTADGLTVRTANLSADINHISERASFGEAVDAMANTGAQLARVRYVDVPGYGTVALGAAWPGLSDLQVRKMQASALSGDWRWREEYRSYDMAGSIFVNNPGLPLPARPVFAPVAMAASVASPHPPVVGNWHHHSEAPMSMIPNGYAPPMPAGYAACPDGCGALVPAANVHAFLASMVAAPVPPPTPAPPAAPTDTAPNADSPEARLDALEARMDAVEAWITEDAMSDVDMMTAALPDTVGGAPAKYDTAQLQALADKDQVFNKDEMNFPIGDCEDVANAVQGLGRANADHDAIKGYIIGVAMKINCVDSLPPDWVATSTQVGPGTGA